MTDTPKREPSARQRIAAMLRQLIEDADQVDVPSIVKLTTESLSKDPDFLRSFLKETLHQSVETVAHGVLASNRRLIRVGSHWVIPEAINDAVAEKDDDAVLTDGERRSRKAWLNDWFEFIEDRSIHLRLGDMDRAALNAASARRRARGDLEYQCAVLFDRLALGLKPKQRVRDQFTDDQIAQVWSGITAPEPGLLAAD